MNKCLRQNWRIFNKVSLRPIQVDVPSEFENKDAWCESVWNHLCDDELHRVACHIRKGRKGYNITLWEDEKYIYLVQVVRSEYNTDDTIIFLGINTEDNMNDFKAIAKFIHKNIEDIIGTSKANVKQFNEMAALSDEKNKVDAEA